MNTSAGNALIQEIIDRHAPPVAPTFANIPAELQELDQWVLWKQIERDGRTTKMPLSVFNRPASSTNREDWTSFDNAVSTFTETEHSGIGFVFTSTDRFCGIDLDGCRDPQTGTISDWAVDEILRFSSYTEISPSGTGLKIWIQANTQLAKGRKKELRVPEIVPKSPAIEIYSQARYFATTGHVHKNYRHIEYRENELQEFLRHHWPAAPAVNAPAHDWRSDDAVVERARRYLQTVPPAISGQCGHNATFHAACLLTKDFVLTDAQAFDVLSEWNQGCQPPWSEYDLKRKISESKKAPGEVGRLRNAGSDRWDRIQIQKYVPNPAAAQLPSRTFGGKDVADLWDSADEAVEWLVDQIFSADQPTIFGAKQKSLKTTLLTDLAVSLSSGFPWLGKFEIPRRLRVLFITGEASEKAAIRKVRRAADSRNLRREDFTDSLRIEALAFPTLPRLEDCEAIQAAVEQYGIEVVLLDPLYMGLSGLNTTNLTEVGPAMRQFMAHCRPAKVIIAHHVKKSASYDDAPNLEDLSQAGISEFAGNYWLMGRMSEYTGDGMHELAIRYGGRDEQFGLLKLDFDERNWTADFSSLTDHREDLKQRRENERVGAQLQAVKGHLSRHGGQATLAALAEAAATKPKRESFQRLIDELCESGQYERFETKGGNNKPCEAIRVKGQKATDSVL